MSGGGSAEAINKTARDDSGDEAEAAPDVSGTGKNGESEADYLGPVLVNFHLINTLVYYGWSLLQQFDTTSISP